MFFHKLKDKIRCKKGASSVVEMPVIILIVMMLIVFVLSLFQIFTYANTQHTMAKQICRSVELTGLESTAWDELNRLNQELGTDCEMEINAETIGHSDKIQQGSTIEIVLTSVKKVEVGGVIDIPITVKSKSKGHCERWWKE